MRTPRRLQLVDSDPGPVPVALLFAGAYLPEKTVYVGPHSKWANPFTMLDLGGQYPSLNDAQVAAMAVNHFRDLVRIGSFDTPNWRHYGGKRGPVSWTYAPLAEVRAELAGQDLACYCPLAEACHADVLLEIANGGDA